MTPSVRASVSAISTWVEGRQGPMIDMFSVFLGPTTSTRSSQAYCPGWESSFL